MAKFSNFQWEDEDEAPAVKNKFRPQSSQSLDPTPQELAPVELEINEDFAHLLASETLKTVSLRMGNPIEGTIISLNDQSNTVLVELSPSQTGVMDRGELVDEEGKLLYKVGDKISAYISSLKQGIHLAKSLGKSHQLAKDLEAAFRSQMPIKGKVTKDIKGGFEVMVAGKRAFCPVSKIDNRFVENKAEYLDKNFEFVIEAFEDDGRNIVVSREALLRKLARQRALEIQSIIERNPDEEFQGTISQLKDFAALVDLGGVEGFLHVSEISYARLAKPEDVLKVSDAVRVKVLRIENIDDRPKIAVSMKAIAQDPWISAAQEFQEGLTYEGKVLSFGKHGAFVQLKPGIDGMIHLSEMSWEKRVHHPSEILKIGDAVSVRVLNVDSEKRRISLSLKEVREDPWKDAEAKYQPGTKVSVHIDNLKGFGAIAHLENGISALIPISSMKSVYGEAYRKHCSPPKQLDAVIAKLDSEHKKILLKLAGDEGEADDSQDYREFLGVRADSKGAASAERGSFGALLAAAQNKKSGN